MRLQQSIAVIGLLLIIACGCANNDDNEWNPELPPITQTGERTFGCKINGNVMVPRDSRVGHPGGGGYAEGLVFYHPDKYLFVKAVDRVSGRGGVAFKVANIKDLGVGEYLLEDIEPGFASTHPHVVYIQAKYKNDLFGSIKGSGKITITRYDDEVISGTFSGKLKGYNNPENIIEITEGRFDFNKETINTTRFY